MAVELSPHIAPAHIVTPARGGAAFSRDFIHERGTVEVTTGVVEPLVTAKASVLTTGTGTSIQFWALKTSLTIFHRPSHQFITVGKAVHELPVAERSLVRIHSDDSWLTPTAPHGDTLSKQFRAFIDDASIRGLELAQVWEAIAANRSQSESDARRELLEISADLEKAVCQALIQG